MWILGQYKNIIVIWVAALSFIIMPSTAYAVFTPLACDGLGNAVPGTTLYHADIANAGGACEYTGIRHVFGQVICNFVIILNSVLGKVYCGLQYAIVNTLSILLTLYVIVFGAQLLLGTAQLNSKEVLIRLLKIAAVWAFATKSAFGINFTFQFFMSFINEASKWVVNVIADNPAALLIDPNTNAPLEIDPGDVMETMPVYAYLDSLAYAAITGPLTTANQKVIGFFLATMIIFPPIFMLGIHWLWQTFTLLVRTVISFMLALSSIAFLIALSPIFLSCMLFQATNHFFENWLRYLISYSLQIVLIFSIITLWVASMMVFADFFNDLSEMIYPYDPTLIQGPDYSPFNTWAICPPQMGKDDLGPTAKCSATFNEVTNKKDLIPPSKLPTRADFVFYVVYHLVTLILIVYAFGVLLQDANKISRNIAGPTHVPPLSGGWGNSGFGSIVGNSMPRMLKSGRTSSSFVQNQHDFMQRLRNRPIA